MEISKWKIQATQKHFSGAPVSRGQAPLGNGVSPYGLQAPDFKGHRVGIISVPEKMKETNFKGKNRMSEIEWTIPLQDVQLKAENKTCMQT